MFQEHLTSFSNLSFFPVPNPTPLRNSANIRQPIILPPGSDPYATQNPSPRGHDGSELQPALDMDPYAALRSESMMQATDLTASEHAGATLNTTTDVLAALQSSENSGCVVQDTVETTMQNESTQILGCEVCNVICNNKAVLKSHKQGKKHLKNLQKLAGLPAVVAAPVETAAFDGGSETKDRKLLQNGASVEPSMFCDVRDHEAFGKHLEGQKHVAEVNQVKVTSRLSSENGLSNPTSAIATPFQPANIGTQDQAKPKPKPNNAESEWCELCEVSCNNKTIFTRHISGKKHLKNLKNSTKTPVTEPPAENQKLTGGLPIHDAFSHLVSVSPPPVQLAPAWSEPEKTPGNPFMPIAPVTPTPITEPVEIPKLTEGEMVISREDKSLWCELCGIGCSTYAVLNFHMSGKKHQKNMKKCQQAIPPNPAPVTEPATTQGPAGEPVNDLDPESHKRKANGPGASHEDLESKRLKMMMRGGAASDALRTCTLCNVVCNSQTSFASHLSGTKHAAKAVKQTKAGSNGQRA